MRKLVASTFVAALLLVSAAASASPTTFDTFFYLGDDGMLVAVAGDVVSEDCAFNEHGVLVDPFGLEPAVFSDVDLSGSMDFFDELEGMTVVATGAPLPDVVYHQTEDGAEFIVDDFGTILLAGLY